MYRRLKRTDGGVGFEVMGSRRDTLKRQHAQHSPLRFSSSSRLWANIPFPHLTPSKLECRLPSCKSTRALLLKYACLTSYSTLRPPPNVDFVQGVWAFASQVLASHLMVSCRLSGYTSWSGQAASSCQGFHRVTRRQPRHPGEMGPHRTSQGRNAARWRSSKHLLRLCRSKPSERLADK